MFGLHGNQPCEGPPFNLRTTVILAVTPTREDGRVSRREEGGFSVALSLNIGLKSVALLAHFFFIEG